MLGKVFSILSDVWRKAKSAALWLLIVSLLPLMAAFMIVFVVVASGPVMIQATLLLGVTWLSVEAFIDGNAALFQRLGSLYVAIALFFVVFVERSRERLERLIESTTNSTEAEANDTYNAIFAFYRRVGLFRSKSGVIGTTEALIAFVGTLQWGFGDLLVQAFVD